MYLSVQSREDSTVRPHFSKCKSGTWWFIPLKKQAYILHSCSTFHPKGCQMAHLSYHMSRGMISGVKSVGRVWERPSARNISLLALKLVDSYRCDSVICTCAGSDFSSQMSSAEMICLHLLPGLWGGIWSLWFLYFSGAAEDPATLLVLAALRDRSWRGCFSVLGAASHEFNKLPPHLSAVLPCSLGEQLSERFLVKE